MRGSGQACGQRQCRAVAWLLQPLGRTFLGCDLGAILVEAALPYGTRPRRSVYDVVKFCGADVGRGPAGYGVSKEHSVWHRPRTPSLYPCLPTDSKYASNSAGLGTCVTPRSPAYYPLVGTWPSAIGRDTYLMPDRNCI